MTISTTVLVNKSLTLCGAAPVSSLTADTNNARILNRVYDIARQSILTECRWNFATTRATLTVTAATGTVPWFFTNETIVFARPSNALRIFGLSDDQVEWREQGEYLIADSAISTNTTSTLEVRYLYDLNDPSKYPPKFTDAFIDKLCSDIAYAIINDAKKGLMFVEKYEKISLPKAMAENAQTGVQQFMKDDAWELSKYFNTNPAA